MNENLKVKSLDLKVYNKYKFITTKISQIEMFKVNVFRIRIKTIWLRS